MDISIVLPYLSNSKSINLCKDLLKKNTKSNYELIEIVDNKDVYEAFNKGVEESNNEIVILINDDMFVSPNWDILYTKYKDPYTILTGYLIECGAIGVSPLNIEKNFGMTVETFDYDGFINYINKLNNPEIKQNSKGWYMPIAFSKETFIPYPNDIKYPHPNDITLIDKILPKLGYKFAQVSSYVYHLQNYSIRKK